MVPLGDGLQFPGLLNMLGMKLRLTFPMLYRRLQSGELGPHEVALRVTSVGLNFRDVLNVLGMYPGDPGDPGGDCAGIVTAAGGSALHR